MSVTEIKFSLRKTRQASELDSDGCGDDESRLKAKDKRVRGSIESVEASASSEGCICTSSVCALYL